MRYKVEKFHGLGEQESMKKTQKRKMKDRKRNRANRKRKDQEKKKKKKREEKIERKYVLPCNLMDHLAIL